MSHHIYQTEAFILASQPRGEASRLYYLFTPKLGLIVAVAQGVRKVNSKLRQQLLDYSLVSVALVKGQEFWRLTGAETILPISVFPAGSAVRQLVVRLFLLLRRLLVGPEESEQLFASLRLLVDFLSVVELTAGQLRSAECIFLLRLLHHLGYLPEDRRFRNYLLFTDWRPELIDRFRPLQPAATALINSFFEQFGF